MASLKERLQKSRERAVQVEGGRITFTVRRPPELDFYHLIDGMKLESDLVRAVVVGWEGVTEQDIGVPGATDDPVPWDADLFKEWIGDRTDYWKPILETFQTLRDEAKAKREALEKN